MRRMQCISLVCVCLLAGSATGQLVYYVDKNATGSGSGQDWCNANPNLSNGIFFALLLNYTEVWVADGTYVPNGDRTATFALNNLLVIRGGYAGCDAPPSDPDLRDVDLYVSVLSGDTGTPGQNKYHVVTGSGTSVIWAELEGFTITGGLADGDETLGQRDGAGLYNVAGSPKITDCTFSNNTALGDAGAIFNRGSSPRLKECNFIQNNGHNGGAIINLDHSNPFLNNCFM